MRMRVTVDDRNGTPLTRLSHFSDLEVRIALNDSRTGSVNVNMESPKVIHLLNEGQRLVRVDLDGILALNAYLAVPDQRGEQGIVACSLHDATLFYKLGYHRYGDAALRGYQIGRTGMRTLADSAMPSKVQLDRGVRHPGVIYGPDTSPYYRLNSSGEIEVGKGVTPANVQTLVAGDALMAVVERGKNIWESMVELTETAGGPEVDFVPIDRDHLPVNSKGVEIPWRAGYSCQMMVSQRIGKDLTSKPFHFNWGRDDLEDMQVTPDLAQVRNYQVQVYPGGERDSRDVGRRALYHYEQGWRDIGILQGWESAGNKESQKVLDARARAVVQAYGTSPKFFTIRPKVDIGNARKFLIDYAVGDTIRAIGKKGNWVADVTGRIVAATITQVDQAGNATVELECVPDVGVTVVGNDS